MQSTTFRVTGMHCSACVMRIESIEDELPGVQFGEASYKKGEMRVTFDTERVDHAQIIAAVAEKGYSAAPLE